MTDHLITYLHDHLAGADMGIGLINALKDRQKEPVERQFFAGLLEEVEQDRATLLDFAAQKPGLEIAFAIPHL